MNRPRTLTYRAPTCLLLLRSSLETAFTDLRQLMAKAEEMVRLAQDLANNGYSTRTVGIKVKYADFRVVTRDLTLAHDLTDAAGIRKAAGECLKRVPLEQRIRLLGVRAGALHPLGEPREAAQTSQGDLPF